MFFCLGYLLLWLLLYCFWCWLVLFCYPFWFKFSGFWGNQHKFFEFSKEELYGWNKLLDVEKNFSFAVTLLFLLYHKWNSETAGTFFLNVWHWLSKQYAVWSHQFCSRSVFMWLSRASNLCNHELFCLFLFWTILLRVIVFKFFIFFNSGNVLVTLEITPTAFKMQPCIFCVSRPFDQIFTTVY